MKNDFDNTLRESRRAAEGLLRSGRINEARKKRKQGESPAELASRIREMSDEDFDKAVADGTLTPEQIRSAGEYERDVWDGDVWAETDEGQNTPLPPYDEFYSNLDKYGYDTKEDYHKFTRYNPNRNKK